MFYIAKLRLLRLPISLLLKSLSHSATTSGTVFSIWAMHLCVIYKIHRECQQKKIKNNNLLKKTPYILFMAIHFMGYEWNPCNCAFRDLQKFVRNNEKKYLMNIIMQATGGKCQKWKAKINKTILIIVIILTTVTFCIAIPHR